MALVSNIVIDLANSTASLTVTFLGNVVETISYGSNQVTFAGRPDINISGVDFLDLTAQVNIFQTALLANFPINVHLSTPYLSCTCTEAHDVPGNKWNLVCIYGATPRVANYSAVGATKTVDLVSRANSKTLDISEWVYFLIQLNHYRASVKSFFNL